MPQSLYTWVGEKMVILEPLRTRTLKRVPIYENNIFYMSILVALNTNCVCGIYNTKFFANKRLVF